MDSRHLKLQFARKSTGLPPPPRQGRNQYNQRFVGAFCFPHGAITLDPISRHFAHIPGANDTSQAECMRLHDAMKHQANMLLSANADVIILSTPHGLRLNDGYLFAGNRRASGTAEWDGDWREYSATLSIDVDTSDIFALYLKARNLPVDILTMGIPNRDVLPLGWGEVVPLWFINRAAQEARLPVPPAVYISQKAYSVGSMNTEFPELIEMGSDIAYAIYNNPYFVGKRVAVVVSGNLAHKHSELPTSPYPFHPVAEEFDTQIQDWAVSDMNSVATADASTALLRNAIQHYDSARSCGYSGLVMLQGILREVVCNYGVSLGANVLAYSVPTYYGMMVNNFIPVP